MDRDEDDDELSNITVSRFPCMPSLVALQQMRNRLHMAQIGKKLMKWTAQVTGRELRKLGKEITRSDRHFEDELREAFILLARARYFHSYLNNIVLEHIGDKADLTVEPIAKCTTGVRVFWYEVLDSGLDSYPHLGIEKGGQAIHEAKYAWRHVLKRILHMLDQRNSFVQVDKSHKGATKKMNVLAKLVIPRTKMSIHYILENLEELDREDFYRMKKILEIKNRRCGHGNARKDCRKCKEPSQDTDEKFLKEKQIVLEPISQTNRISASGLEQDSKIVSEPISQTNRISASGLEQDSKIVSEPISQTNRISASGLEQDSKIVSEPISQTNRISSSGPDQDSKCILCESSLLKSNELPNIEEETEAIVEEVKERENEIETFKARIDEVVKQTKEIEESGYISDDNKLNDFLKTATVLQGILKKRKDDTILRVRFDIPRKKLCTACRNKIDILSEEQICSKNYVTPSEYETSDKVDLPDEFNDEARDKKPKIFETPEEYQTSKSVEKTERKADLELGSFETEVQEINKIVRVRNEDGSLSVERRIIKITKEVRSGPPSATKSLDTNIKGNMYQSSDTFDDSQPFSTSNTVGVVTIKESFVKQPKRNKSEVIECSLAMCDPLSRNCMSSMSLMSSCTISSWDSLRNTEINKTITSTYKENHPPPRKKSQDVNNNGLTESERDLINSINTCPTEMKIILNSDIEIKECNKNKVTKTYLLCDKKEDTQ